MENLNTFFHSMADQGDFTRRLKTLHDALDRRNVIQEEKDMLLIEIAYLLGYKDDERFQKFFGINY